MEWVYKYISIASAVGFLGFLIRYLIQKKIDSYFNKKLETYKQELATITENAKYDISKKLYDFEAYASKKHVVYPELYSLAFEIWTDLKEFISKVNREDRMDLYKNAFELRYYDEIRPILNKIDTAFNYFYRNELYLSKNTAIVYEEAMRAQFSFLEKIDGDFQENFNNDNWQDPSILLIKVDKEHLNSIKEKMSVLKETMYKELSYTHFEEMDQKEEALL